MNIAFAAVAAESGVLELTATVPVADAAGGLVFELADVDALGMLTIADEDSVIWGVTAVDARFAFAPTEGGHRLVVHMDGREVDGQSLTLAAKLRPGSDPAGLRAGTL